MNLRPSTPLISEAVAALVKTAVRHNSLDPPFITPNRRSSQRTSPLVTFRLAGVTSPRTIGGMLAQGFLAISLVVRIYDGYHVPNEQLAKARATVERIMMNDAGVAVTWPTCPCLSSVGVDELVIRIAAATPLNPPAALGVSLVDVRQKIGTLATVFADRVQAMAARALVDEGELLGRVIAHEIAHLLIGTSAHSDRGLMRGGWKASEVARNQPSDWQLSRSERLEIRRALLRRSSELPPALMAADAEAASDVTSQ